MHTHQITLEEQFILDTLNCNHIDLENFEKRKRSYAKREGISCFSNIALLAAYRKLIQSGKIEDNRHIFSLLQKQESRSLSGIVHVTVVTRRWACGGACVYCPDEDGMPKSYLATQPAIMRAIPNKFDPRGQIETRFKALEMTGHETNKIELHILGGSFSTHPTEYKKWFIKECFDTANGFIAPTLEDAMIANESSEHRLIGITVETRPDLIDEEEISFLRNLGITRIEIGVQSIYDDVLAKNMRGHGSERIISATKMMRDAGFKINYHMMPNLYGSSKEKDVSMFIDLFSKPDFKPDLLKIYPCVVIPNTGLYGLYKAGKYTPYSDDELIDVLSKIKKVIPPYVRIMRLGRDVPAPEIEAGYKITNIRQQVQKKLYQDGFSCACIRCREIRDTRVNTEDIQLVRRDYDANDGKEIFLSFEDTKNDKIIALLRLRFPSGNVFLPELQNASIIRELHTYGHVLKFDTQSQNASQHHGFGKKLIAEAEKITINESALGNIAIISGVGVRDYYRKQRYKLIGTYMVKKLLR